MTDKNILSKTKENIKNGNERAARESVFEDLFYDFNRNRVQIYKINFFRGIFFGLGSVLGGTVVVVLLVWLLSFFVNVPGIGQSVEQVQQTLQNNKK